MAEQPVTGEVLNACERVVVSPAPGVFFPDAHIAEGDEVQLTDGQVVGRVAVRGGDGAPVVCRFRGSLMGLLANPGERVRLGQPIAWIRCD